MHRQGLGGIALGTGLSLAGALASLAGSVAAQDSSSRTFSACYVPEVGVVYLIDEPGLPTDCLAEAHQPFSWTEGPGGAPELTEGSVTTDVLADAAVTEAKLANAAVTEAKLANAAVTGPKLATAAVNGGHIADDAVTGEKLAVSAVTSSHILDGTVTGLDLADAAVTGDDIQDGSVARTDLDPDVITAKALAYVDGTAATPVLLRDRNAVSVTRRAGSPQGVYEITFAAPVDLATDYVTATPLGAGLTVGLVLLSNSVLAVDVRNSENMDTDAPFFVIVF